LVADRRCNVMIPTKIAILFYDLSSQLEV
jgi:hypothetical protein